MQKHSAIPTAEAIQKLADEIARDGIDAHYDEVAAMATIAETVSLCEAAAKVIKSATSPEVVRDRAFLVLARHWPEITRAAERRRTFGRAVRTLGSRWEHHRQLRRSPTPALDEVWRSRAALEAARTEVLMLRSPR